MASILANRIDKLAAKLPPATRTRRVIRIVANKEDEVAALELAKAEGYDPEKDNHVVIIRLIAGVKDTPVEPREPTVLWRSPG